MLEGICLHLKDRCMTARATFSDATARPQTQGRPGRFEIVQLNAMVSACTLDFQRAAQ
jgi:hypothetical protein